MASKKRCFLTKSLILGSCRAMAASSAATWVTGRVLPSLRVCEQDCHCCQRASLDVEGTKLDAKASKKAVRDCLLVSEVALFQARYHIAAWPERYNPAKVTLEEPGVLGAVSSM